MNNTTTQNTKKAIAQDETVKELHEAELESVVGCVGARLLALEEFLQVLGFLTGQCRPMGRRAAICQPKRTPTRRIFIARPHCGISPHPAIEPLPQRGIAIELDRPGGGAFAVQCHGRMVMERHCHPDCRRDMEFCWVPGELSASIRREVGKS